MKRWLGAAKKFLENGNEHPKVEGTVALQMLHKTSDGR